MRSAKEAIKRKIGLGSVLVALVLLLPPLSYAKTRVIGEGVSFRPGKLTPGGAITMDIRFTVWGIGPAVPIAFSVVEAGRTPDWSHPSIPSAVFEVNPSPYSLRFTQRIPASIPATGVCLNVYAHFTGTALRSSLLIMNACYGAGTSTGTGQTIVLNHDLAVKINSVSIDRARDLDPGPGATYPGNISFTIKNMGTAAFPRLSPCWNFFIYLPTATGPYPAGWNNTATGICDPIPGGGSTAVTKIFMIPEKTSMIRIELSVPRDFEETDISNNKEERGITVFIPSGVRPATPDIRKK